MSASIIIVSGEDSTAEYPLNKTIENLIGRGKECQIQLDDPRASRIHARFVFADGQWMIIDSGSRNGTVVNGSKTDSAVLANGAMLTIGDTELLFTESLLNEQGTLEQINLEIPLSEDLEELPAESGRRSAGGDAFESLKEAGRLKDLSDLHEFSLRTNSIDTEDQLVDLALEIVAQRTKATSVAFLLPNEFGELDIAGQKTTDKSIRLEISDRLTQAVVGRMRAVWLQQEMMSLTSDNVPGISDAICVPIIGENRAIGALHIYHNKKKFQRHDVDFAVALCGILSTAMVRIVAHQNTKLKLDRLQVKNADFDELIGNCKPIVDLKNRITRIAKASGCILIHGESGSGKELVARAVHRNSLRASRPMLSVNCAAIPDELMESQLFGHVKGAFTGADRDHTGWFQQANKGTLFLDEVGELNLVGQAKLLRVLEGHPFLPVGGTNEIKVDVRVVAATNRDLREFVEQKRFREDLYYRLSVFQLIVPPLRVRGDDIDLLADFFLEHFKRQSGRKALKLGREARDTLRTYPWPGNVRQLRNVMDSAVVLAEGQEIRPEDLTLHEVYRTFHHAHTPLSDNELKLPGSVVAPSPTTVSLKSESPDALVELFDTLNVEIWEQRLIQAALKRTQGNIPAAAEIMGMSRATLYRKLERSPNSNPSNPS